jgi:hypothetical protein
VGTINDASYQGSATGTLVIGKATATVTLANLSQTYTGSGLSATATTTPTGLAVNFTYNGSVTLPVNVSSYAVVSTINDANYQGSATGTLVIGKATATVAPGELEIRRTWQWAGAAATTTRLASVDSPTTVRLRSCRRRYYTVAGNGSQRRHVQQSFHGNSPPSPSMAER